MPQHFEPGVLVLHVFRYHLQLKAVVKRPKYAFGGVGEIGNLIGRREEGYDGNVCGLALIRVAAFVERRQQGVEYAVVGFEDFVEENNVALRNFAVGNHPGLAAVNRRQRLFIRLQLLCQHVRRARVGVIIGRGRGKLPEQLLVCSVVLQNGLCHVAGDKAAQVDAAENLLFVCLF